MVRKLQLRHDEPVEYPQPTEADLRRLYMIHICNFDTGSVLERLLPFHMYGFTYKLKESEREELWIGVDKFIRQTERRHFKLSSQPEEYHFERICAFYDLAQVRWNYSVGWICKAFMTGFSEIEALLQCRRLGIALDGDGILEYKKWYIKHFVEYFDFRRKHEKEGINFRTWYYRKYKSFPTKAYEQAWHLRSEQLVDLINRCPSFQIYGFKTGRSFDELYEREFNSLYSDAEEEQEM